MSKEKRIKELIDELKSEGLVEAHIETSDYDVKLKDEKFKIKRKKRGNERKGISPFVLIFVFILLIGVIYYVTTGTGKDIKKGLKKDLKENKLILLIKGSKINSAKTLLNEIKEIKNEVDTSGRTALHYASEKGYKGVIKELIDKGADINKKDKYGLTPLHLASYNNRVEVVKILILRGAKLGVKGGEHGWSPLHYAAERGHIEVVKLLLDAGADINDKDTTEGETPLHVAAEANQVEMVKFLLDKGAEVDARDFEEETPLHDAAYWGRVEVIKVLVKRGANLKAKDKDGKTPFERAEESDYIKDKDLREKIVNILKGKILALSLTPPLIIFTVFPTKAI